MGLYGVRAPRCAPSIPLDTVARMWCIGSKHFAPGARIYLRRVMGYPDDVPDIEVAGRHRATHRYVRMIVRASWLEGWRADLVYSPQVIRLLWPKWDGAAASKERAEFFASLLAKLTASKSE